MNGWMERFYSSSQHLRLLGDLFDMCDWQPGEIEHTTCASTGNQIPAQLRQTSRKFLQASLVIDT
jgi:hypothetical protein